MYYKKRPVLKLNYGTFEILAEAAGAAALLAGAYLLITYWAGIPQTIPTHFGFSGEADSWGSKSALPVLYGVTAIVYLALTLLSRSPHIFNYACRITEQNAEFQYRNALVPCFHCSRDCNSNLFCIPLPNMQINAC